MLSIMKTGKALVTGLTSVKAAIKEIVLAVQDFRAQKIRWSLWAFDVCESSVHPAIMYNLKNGDIKEKAVDILEENHFYKYFSFSNNNSILYFQPLFASLQTPIVWLRRWVDTVMFFICIF